MFSNYLRIALRNMSRQKGYSFINVAGLGVGMAAFVMITLFVVNELAFDQHHPGGDRTYQIQLDAQLGEQVVLTASSPAVMAGAFKDEFPEIEAVTRIDNWPAILVSYQNQAYTENALFAADSSVFELFSVPLVRGDEATALNRPNTLIMSEATAAKYFGSEDPIGRTVIIDSDEGYEVTGVFRTDRRNAHFRPEIIVSFLSSGRADDPVWLNNSFYTYVKLHDGADVDAFAAKVLASVPRFIGDQVEQFMGMPFEQAKANGFKYDWVIQSLPEMYLYNKADDQMGRAGDVRYVYILAAIAAFILLIACINFMNLATARAAGRAREVGLRKVMGSERGQLIRQFLGESVITSFFGMIVAVVLVVALIPAFNALADVSLVFEPWIVAVMLGIVVVTGLFAGAYPAFVLSSFQPASVLKGQMNTGRRGAMLRSGLVVFQFAISITMVVSTLVVYRQLDYIRTQDLGFEPEQLVVLQFQSQEGRDGFDAFRNELLRNPDITNAAWGSIMPGQNHIHNTTVFNAERMAEQDFMVAQAGNVSEGYLDVLGLDLVAGRDFDEDRAADVDNWIVNESAIARMGYTSAEEAIGQRLTRPDGEDSEIGEIIGVVSDAHYESLHKAIMPVVFGHKPYGKRYLPVRMATPNIQASLEFLEDKYAGLEPAFPFSYYFADDDFMELYAQEQRLGTIYTTFSILAVLIACLGLFGLASYVTVLRTKEIGVRKVLGASVPGIVRLLSREFTVLVLISCIFAFPVAWYMMDKWLAGFSYATEMSWWIFALAAGIAIVIAWGTVGYQSVKAALLDPVKAIRHQ